ncbi:Ig-like domain-containing protein [Neptunomonas marina]|uniref:Tandem-95 repeat protein n=1 Tax=Neptunomonas marina TaxID=1815562 RepID=A0A437Q704_9GAMM|nr:Ig-like domain-containing protein [Neptunomonas marina]RVU30315.1 tandem-95 repeat protein [Neptunomonas marina]
MRKRLVAAMGLSTLLLPLGAYALSVTVNGVQKTVNTVSIQQSSSGVVITTDPQVEFSSGNGGGGNQAPVAVNDSAATAVDTEVIIDLDSNDSDDSGLDPTTITIVSAPNNGSLGAVNASGQVEYTPNGGYIGYDQFRYTIKDNQGVVSNQATVTLEVGDVSSLPVANGDSATTDQDVAVDIDILANDTDNVGLVNSSVAIVNDVSHGTTSVNSTTGVVTYTPTAGYTGNDSFTYTVNDGDGNTSPQATVNIVINSVSACGNLPSYIDIGQSINWASPGGQETIKTQGTTEVFSRPFTTTSGGSYGGTINIAEGATFENVVRKVWISECPGGPAISAKCETEGVSSRTIRWGQVAGYRYCELDKNTDYYLNMQNTANCSGQSTCTGYRSILTNKKPN